MSDLPPLTTFGRAVAHLKLVFACAPFEDIARSPVGRSTGITTPVCCGEDVACFAGLALATERLAETWLRGERGFSGAEAADGDCIVLNSRQAENAGGPPFIIAHVGGAIPRTPITQTSLPGRARPPAQCRLAILSTERRATINLVLKTH